MSTSPRPSASLKQAKVQLRLRAAQKDLIAEAARVKQTTLTDFVVEYALNAAQQVLAEQVYFELPPDRWEAFCEAMDRPPRDNQALRRLLTEKTVFDGE